MEVHVQASIGHIYFVSMCKIAIHLKMTHILNCPTVYEIEGREQFDEGPIQCSILDLFEAIGISWVSGHLFDVFGT